MTTAHPPSGFSLTALLHFTASPSRHTPTHSLSSHIRDVHSSLPSGSSFALLPLQAQSLNPWENRKPFLLSQMGSPTFSSSASQAHRLMAYSVLLTNTTHATSVDECHTFAHMCTFPRMHTSVCMFAHSTDISKHVWVECTQGALHMCANTPQAQNRAAQRLCCAPGGLSRCAAVFYLRPGGARGKGCGLLAGPCRCRGTGWGKELIV